MVLLARSIRVERMTPRAASSAEMSRRNRWPPLGLPLGEAKKPVNRKTIFCDEGALQALN